MSVVLKNCVLPFFPGFYGSLFDTSELGYIEADNEYNYYVDEIGYDVAEETNLKVDDFYPSDEQVKAYENDVCEEFVDAIMDYLPNWIERVEFVGIDRPRYYNFTNDKLICNIVLTNDWEEKVSDFLYEYADELAEDIKNDWSSRDGFISFVKNDVNKWGEAIEEEPDLYLPLLMGYAISYNEGVDYDEMSGKLSEIAYENTSLHVTCYNEKANRAFSNR